MRLRRLTKQGVSRFGAFLDELDGRPDTPLPITLLNNAEFSEEVVPVIEVSEKAFDNRLALARYLMNNAGLDEVAGVLRDVGIWGWLTVFYFDQLCPPDEAGRRSPGQRERLLPALSDWKTYYRHLVAGPYRLCRAHRDRPERLRAVLANPPHQPGDLYEQMASRMKLATNPAIMETTVRLYWDSDSDSLKVGARGRGPGSARRLAEVMYQFDLSWDLFIMDTDDILALLPDEFDRFRNGELGN